MQNKAVFLDRDGTINIDKDYLYKIEDFEYLPGVIQALKLLQDAGYILVVITNQSGIARGFYTEEEYRNLNKWMIDNLKSQGITIAASYYCPHHPESEFDSYRVKCNCRKPNTELFYKAIEELNIDIDNSFTIGDKLRDVSICKNSKAKGFVIYSGEEVTDGNINFIKGNLLDAAKIIIEENKVEQKNERLD